MWPRYQGSPNHTYNTPNVLTVCIIIELRSFQIDDCYNQIAQFHKCSYSTLRTSNPTLAPVIEMIKTSVLKFGTWAYFLKVSFVCTHLCITCLRCENDVNWAVFSPHIKPLKMVLPNKQGDMFHICKIYK